MYKKTISDGFVNKKKIGVICYSLLFVVVLAIYLLTPSSYYSYTLNCYAFVQYIISCIFFWYLKGKVNFFDFDVIFQFVYLFAMFVYPVFLYEDNPYIFSLFKYQFNENVITKGSLLALVGMQAYLLGSFLVPSLKHKETILYPKPLYNGILVIAFVIVFFLFIILGGLATFSNLYGGGSDSTSNVVYYLLILLAALLTVATAIYIHNYRLQQMETSFVFQRSKKRGLEITEIVLLCTVSVFVLSMFSVGSRTYPIQFLLLLLGAYSLEHRISLQQMLLLILAGGVLMFYVLINRSGRTSSIESAGLLDIFSDLIINNRNTYVAIDYVEHYGLSWGKTMLLILLSPIPFLQSIVCGIFNIDPTDCSSAYIITKYSLGTNSNFDLGFGTNIIADLYIAFGLVGVIIGMLILGYFIDYLTTRARTSVYLQAIYLVMISYSIYIVRSEFFVYIRLLIWSIFLVNVLKLYPVVLLWKRKRF